MSELVDKVAGIIETLGYVDPGYERSGANDIIAAVFDWLALPSEAAANEGRRVHERVLTSATSIWAVTLAEMRRAALG